MVLEKHLDIFAFHSIESTKEQTNLYSTMNNVTFAQDTFHSLRLRLRAGRLGTAD